MKKISFLLIWAGLLINTSLNLPARAESFKSYDENVVRAYKSLKIKTIKPDIKVYADAAPDAIDAEIQKYLSENKYFEKNLKNKPGIFLVDLKNVQVKEQNGEVTKLIKVNEIYNVKNPEKFMFTLNNKISKKDLADKEAIANNINNDATTYAIISKKIEKKNSPLFVKTVRGGYNGFLGMFIYMPKLGLGSVFNPPFEWLKTNTPSDIYKGISNEVEQISTGEKEQLQVKYFEGK